MKDINQVVILAGGKGTRMREMTHDLPKPMVEIGKNASSRTPNKYFH